MGPWYQKREFILLYFKSIFSDRSTYDPLRSDNNRSNRPHVPPQNIGRSDLDPFGFNPQSGGKFYCRINVSCLTFLQLK